MAGPKLFVSYSWTSPNHEAWVIELATELRESGVDVILDKWDLKEGHDAHAFMESMVTDPEIKKVMLVCDKAYVDKTDGRSGGVGTEAQIISGEIYDKQAQDKFVAIVRERDDEGNAYLPAYYKSRIYIDLSDLTKYAENFERLLRWVFDQPLYRKPGLGEKPAFLSETAGAPALATSFRYKRAMDAITNNRDHAIPAASEYFTTLVVEMEKLRIDPEVDLDDDAVVHSIESFIPYRNEAVGLFLALALYRDCLETRTMLHRFFEELIPYLTRPEHVMLCSNWDFDNFRFIIHELFLYAVACLIRYERFDSAAYLMSNEYYVPKDPEYGRNAMVPFEIFLRDLRSLEHRNNRLKLNRRSLRADILVQRCKGLGVEFRHLMQADFVLFIRGLLDRPEGAGSWWPETFIYIDGYSGAFEVFARSRSTSYFNRAKVLLGIENKDALQPLLQTFAEGSRRPPGWPHSSYNPARLLGFNEIGTKP